MGVNMKISQKPAGVYLLFNCRSCYRSGARVSSRISRRSLDFHVLSCLYDGIKSLEDPLGAKHLGIPLQRNMNASDHNS